MKVKIPNPIDTCEEQTALSKEANAGASSLTVLNNNGISANNFIVLAKMGTEQAEIVQVSSISGANTLVLSGTTRFGHGSGSFIFVTPFNQVEISRKATASSTFAVLTTIDLEVDQFLTIFEDTGGQTTNFYKSRFKNESSGQFSSFSQIRAGTGRTTREASAIIDTILLRTEDPDGEFTTRQQVLDDVNLGYQEVVNALIQASAEYFQRKLEIPTEDFKFEYSLPDDFREVQEVRDGNENIVNPNPRATIFDLEPGYEIVGRNIIYINDVPQPSSTSTPSPTTVLINDAFDTDGTWAAELDAENVTTDLDEFKVGTGSINFDVDVSNDSGNVAAITNSTMTAQDLSDFDDSGKWRVWVFIPDVTYTSNVTFRWGSSSTVFWALTVERDFRRKSLHDGWNLLEFNWGDSAVAETGDPGTSDAEAIDYLSVRINYTANQPDDTDYRIDAVKIANSWNGNNFYEVTYLFQPNQLVDEMDLIQLAEGQQGLLIDYAVAQILFRKGERDTQAERTLKRFNDNLSTFITQSAKRTRRMIGFRLYGYRRKYGRQRILGNVVTKDKDFILRKV